MGYSTEQRILIPDALIRVNVYGYYNQDNLLGHFFINTELETERIPTWVLLNWPLWGVTYRADCDKIMRCVAGVARFRNIKRINYTFEGKVLDSGHNLYDSGFRMQGLTYKPDNITKRYAYMYDVDFEMRKSYDISGGI